MILHFNFQVVAIVWGLIVGLAWLSLVMFVDPALEVLGTKKFGTPRQNCILVAWGYETQKRLMWTKVHFLSAVYVFSFVASLLFCIRQLRVWQRLDRETAHMKHYAAVIHHLPIQDGTQRVEEDLAKVLAEATGEKLIG